MVKIIVGVPKEIKDRENRVALTPKGAQQMVAAGHTVLIENNAGVNSGFSNDEYSKAGASIVSTEKAWGAELVLKVKEPMRAEYHFLRDQIIFTYFHLAGASATLTKMLVQNKTTAIAYETVEDKEGKVPLLAPMSAVAGNMAVTIGSYYLAKFKNGKGIQLGTVLGEKYGKVVVIGDGVVGQHAAKTAYGMGADVYLFGLNEQKFENMKKSIGPDVHYVLSTPENVAKHVKDADLLVGGVYIHGSKAPWVVTRDMVKTMERGSVIVDVSIDQGGCVETSQPTKHSYPVFIKYGVIHYCVTNMPGAYPRTSTIALTNATLPYALKLAKKGFDAVKDDDGFAKGVNTHKGYVTSKPVADVLKLQNSFKELKELW